MPAFRYVTSLTCNGLLTIQLSRFMGENGVLKLVDLVMVFIMVFILFLISKKQH